MKIDGTISERLCRTCKQITIFKYDKHKRHSRCTVCGKMKCERNPNEMTRNQLQRKNAELRRKLKNQSILITNMMKRIIDLKKKTKEMIDDGKTEERQ